MILTVFCHQERWVFGRRDSGIRSGTWRRTAARPDSDEDRRKNNQRRKDAWNESRVRSSIVHTSTSFKAELSQLPSFSVWQFASTRDVMAERQRRPMLRSIVLYRTAGRARRKASQYQPILRMPISFCDARFYCYRLYIAERLTRNRLPMAINSTKKQPASTDLRLR